MRKLALAVLPWIALSAWSCASTFGESAGEEASADVVELQRRVLELQRRAAMADVEIDRLRRQVADLESRLRTPSTARVESPNPAPSTAGDPPAVAAAPPAAVAAPEAVEEVAAFEESELATEPVRPPAAVSESAPQPASESVSASVEALSREQPISAAAQAIYDRGYTLYHQGRYLDAEAAFQQFLQSFPSTELTDNAHYWVGESRFARGDVPGALAAFQETVERYPDGNKVPDALLKMGDCHRAMGQEDKARARFEEVLRRFPGSAASAMAEERMGGG